MMNHMLHFPQLVRDKRVFEPFGGSGALGFMALRAGAAHVDFLDINPRACEFQRENAALNQFSPDRFRALEGDIASFEPETGYDLIIANPPFVPTPEGIAGTLTSNGGRDGSRFVDILLRRLNDLLVPEGAALLYVLQLARRGEPLLIASIPGLVSRRRVEVTPAQENPTPLQTYLWAYRRLFPDAGAAIAHWESSLVEAHGKELDICHYIVEVGPTGEGPTTCALRDDFAERFGAGFLVPSNNPDRVAFSRVFENFVPAG
jgi:SAM-dependent methyltransferase